MVSFRQFLFIYSILFSLFVAISPQSDSVVLVPFVWNKDEVIFVIVKFRIFKGRMVIFPLEHFKSEILAIREVLENTFEPPHPRNHRLPHNVLLYIPASLPALGRAFPYLSHPHQPGISRPLPILALQICQQSIQCSSASVLCYFVCRSLLTNPYLRSSFPSFCNSISINTSALLIILTYRGKHGKYYMCIYLSALH